MQDQEEAVKAKREKRVKKVSFFFLFRSFFSYKPMNRKNLFIGYISTAKAKKEKRVKQGFCSEICLYVI